MGDGNTGTGHATIRQKITESSPQDASVSPMARTGAGKYNTESTAEIQHHRDRGDYSRSVSDAIRDQSSPEPTLEPTPEPARATPPARLASLLSPFPSTPRPSQLTPETLRASRQANPITENPIPSTPHPVRSSILGNTDLPGKNTNTETFDQALGKKLPTDSEIETFRINTMSKYISPEFSESYENKLQTAKEEHPAFAFASSTAIGGYHELKEKPVTTGAKAAGWLAVDLAGGAALAGAGSLISKSSTLRKIGNTARKLPAGDKLIQHSGTILGAGLMAPFAYSSYQEINAPTLDNTGALRDPTTTEKGDRAGRILAGDVLPMAAGFGAGSAIRSQNPLQKPITETHTERQFNILEGIEQTEITALEGPRIHTKIKTRQVSESELNPADIRSFSILDNGKPRTLEVSYRLSESKTDFKLNTKTQSIEGTTTATIKPRAEIGTAEQQTLTGDSIIITDPKPPRIEFKNLPQDSEMIKDYPLNKRPATQQPHAELFHSSPLGKNPEISNINTLGEMWQATGRNVIKDPTAPRTDPHINFYQIDTTAPLSPISRTYGVYDPYRLPGKPAPSSPTTPLTRQHSLKNWMDRSPDYNFATTVTNIRARPIREIFPDTAPGGTKYIPTSPEADLWHSSPIYGQGPPLKSLESYNDLWQASGRIKIREPTAKPGELSTAPTPTQPNLHEFDTPKNNPLPSILHRSRNLMPGEKPGYFALDRIKFNKNTLRRLTEDEAGTLAPLRDPQVIPGRPKAQTDLWKRDIILDETKPLTYTKTRLTEVPRPDTFLKFPAGLAALAAPQATATPRAQILSFQTFPTFENKPTPQNPDTVPLIDPFQDISPDTRTHTDTDTRTDTRTDTPLPPDILPDYPPFYDPEPEPPGFTPDPWKPGPLPPVTIPPILSPDLPTLTGNPGHSSKRHHSKNKKLKNEYGDILNLRIKGL